MVQYLTEDIGSIDYVANQKKTLDIPRNGILLQLNLRVQFTITNGVTPPTDPLFQALARIIRRADLVLGGRDTVVQHSGEALAARATYETGNVPDGMEDTVVLTGSAATAYDVTIPIIRWLPRSRNPLSTADDLRKMTQATLEITWGDDSDIYGTSNSAAISAVTCDVEAEYLFGAPLDIPLQIRQLSEINEAYTASNDKLAITIDGSTGLFVRSVGIASLVAKVGSNAPLASGKIKFQSAQNVFHANKGPALQSDNKSKFGFESLLTGYYYRQFTWAGDLSMAINTDPRALPADLKAIFDVTFTSGTHELLLGIEAIRPLQLG